MHVGSVLIIFASRYLRGREGGRRTKRTRGCVLGESAAVPASVQPCAAVALATAQMARSDARNELLHALSCGAHIANELVAWRFAVRLGEVRGTLPKLPSPRSELACCVVANLQAAAREGRPRAGGTGGKKRGGCSR